MRLGDARRGKLAENLVGFGRALRRAGLPVDSARIALAQDATLRIGVQNKADLRSALECTLVSHARDLPVFHELFAAYFRDPELANKLLAQMLPKAQGKAAAKPRRQRVNEALSPARPQPQDPARVDTAVKLDAAMSASTMERLKRADFNQLSADEYALVQALASRIACRLPCYLARRTSPGKRGNQLDWPSYFRELARLGDDAPPVQWRERRKTPLPLLLLIDISGSMERYSRMMLSFLHNATRQQRQRAVFAFGTSLSDLSQAFAQADTDDMLMQASVLIGDFAGGTRLGESLMQLRIQHARRLVGGRTMVLLVSDGLDTGDTQMLGKELAWLKRHCGSLLWLNPLLRFDGFAPIASGPAQLNKHADAMLAIHNLERLEQLAHGIEQLMRSARR